MSDMKATRLTSTALASLLILAAPVMVQVASAADNVESQRTDPGRHKQMHVQRHTAQRFEGRQRSAHFNGERVAPRNGQFTAQYANEREATRPGYERQGYQRRAYERRAAQPNSEVGYVDQAPHGRRGNAYAYTNGYPADDYYGMAYPPTNGYPAGYADPNGQPMPVAGAPVGDVANGVLNGATLGLLGNPYPPNPAYAYGSGYEAYGRPIVQPGWIQPWW